MRSVRPMAALVVAATFVAAVSVPVLRATAAELTDQSDADADAQLPMEGLDLAARAAGAFGIYLDDRGGVVVAMPRGRVFQSDLALDTGIAYSVKVLDVSEADVATLRQRVVAFRASLDLSYAYAAYFDRSRGKFVIETDAPATAFAEAIKGYEAIVDLRSGGKLESTSGRYADTSPFKGAASITGTNDSGNTGLCSSGYPAKKGTLPVLITAGHCFKINATIRAGTTGGSGQIVGSVTTREYPNYEAELISGGSYYGSVYTGDEAHPTKTHPILGRAVLTVGQQNICYSGQTTEIGCQWVYADDDIVWCNSGNLLCTEHLNAYHGFPESQGGDSGGPVFLFWTYQSLTGVLIHGDNVGKGCFVVIGCTFYAQPWQEIFSHWGLTQVCAITCIKPI